MERTLCLSEIRDAVLIVNPQAGGGRRVPQLDEARRIFRNAGIETELQNTTGPGDATVLARQAVEQSRQLAIVCGGDGTVNEAVNGLACSQVPLAVLPAGTANVLAKELSLPWNLPRAAERIVSAQYRRIALGLATPGKIKRRASLFPERCGRGSGRSLVAAVRPEIKLKAGNHCVLAGRISPALAIRFPAVSAMTDGRPRDRCHARHRRPHETLRRSVQNHHRSRSSSARI